MLKKACLLALATLLLAACQDVVFGLPERVDGSGNVTSVVVDVDEFDEIALAGIGDAEVTVGVDPSLTIETDDNLQDYLIAEVDGSTLELRVRSGYNLDTSEGVRFQIGTPSLSRVEISGAGTVTADDVASDDFTVVLSGAGDLVFNNLDATSLRVTISGAGKVELSGAIGFQEVTLSGMGDYEAADLESEEAVVEISGVGSGTVWVTRRLEATLSGVGSLGYWGSPEVERTISGSGAVNALGEK
jgi:hypothetical protein